MCFMAPGYSDFWFPPRFRPRPCNFFKLRKTRSGPDSLGFAIWQTVEDHDRQHGVLTASSPGIFKKNSFRGYFITIFLEFRLLSPGIWFFEKSPGQIDQNTCILPRGKYELWRAGGTSDWTPKLITRMSLTKGGVQFMTTIRFRIWRSSWSKADSRQAEVLGPKQIQDRPKFLAQSRFKTGRSSWLPRPDRDFVNEYWFSSLLSYIIWLLILRQECKAVIKNAIIG